MEDISSFYGVSPSSERASELPLFPDANGDFVKKSPSIRSWERLLASVTSKETAIGRHIRGHTGRWSGAKSCERGERGARRERHAERRKSRASRQQRSRTRAAVDLENFAKAGMEFLCSRCPFWERMGNGESFVS